MKESRLVPGLKREAIVGFIKILIIYSLRESILNLSWIIHCRHAGAVDSTVLGSDKDLLSFFAWILVMHSSHVWELYEKFEKIGLGEQNNWDNKK